MADRTGLRSTGRADLGAPRERAWEEREWLDRYHVVACELLILSCFPCEFPIVFLLQGSQLRGITGITQGCSLDLLKIQTYGCTNLRSEQNNAFRHQNARTASSFCPGTVPLSRTGRHGITSLPVRRFGQYSSMPSPSPRHVLSIGATTPKRTPKRMPKSDAVASGLRAALSKGDPAVLHQIIEIQAG